MKAYIQQEKVGDYISIEIRNDDGKKLLDISVREVVLVSGGFEDREYLLNPTSIVATHKAVKRLAEAFKIVNRFEDITTNPLTVI